MKNIIASAVVAEPDPQHIYVFCPIVHQRRALVVCVRRCSRDGRCLAFWERLDFLGLNREHLDGGR